jgi:hypothetical protein
VRGRCIEIQLNSVRLIAGILIILLNTLLAGFLALRIDMKTCHVIFEATAGRVRKRAYFSDGFGILGRRINKAAGKSKGGDLYKRAKEKLKRAGHGNESSVNLYICMKYLVPTLIFIVSFMLNFPDVLRSIAAALIVPVSLELIIAARRKEINLRFQKYAYKIYKYLHNQVSSGIKVPDAIKSAYEIVEDPLLRGALIKLSAMYELTCDIEESLEDFKSNFDSQEAEAFCVALKQGIATGNNSDLLAKQEEVMFGKYFSFIQAETDGMKTKSTLAAAMFTAVIVIMISVPLLNDVKNAVSGIFVH